MRKGFTLVELLAVIAILSILALVSFPIVSKVMSDMKGEANKSQEKLIIDASKYWVNDHLNLLSDTVGDIYTLELSTLIEGNYLNKGQVKDLEHDTVLNDACIKITTEAHKYTYQFEKKCQ